MAELTELTRGKDFVPQAVVTAAGGSGEDVRRAERYLSAFGYMESPELERFGLRPQALAARPKATGAFDDQLRAGLKRFQRFNGLPQTGELDQPTLDLMARPRCGFPDAEIGEFSLQGSKWPKTNLTYAFQNFSPDLTPAQIRGAVQQAFALWAAVTPLTFTEVGINNSPDITISFGGGDHGCGFPFDGAGGVLAHAFYPGTSLSGDTHFDELETWSVNLPPSGVDLVTVAAHEFGHALGLAHSSVNTALMAPFYGGPHRHLDDDDRSGIQALYGAKKGWSGWVALGAPPVGFAGAPSVVSRNAEVCNIYVRGNDNALWQQAFAEGRWHGWGRHDDGGVLASEPALGTMGPDHEHVFVRGTDDQVWQKFWTGGGGWSGWFALGAPPGGFVGAPAVVSRNNTVCNIYVRGNDNALWQKAWFNNAWHDWGRHDDGGVLASEPALGSMGPNHEHVFVRGTDNQVWQKWWVG
ncbi:MAG: matrixin family metalloprotease [Acetobacteraceae bacterium]|nr:matrixin family metalloprotease [Acetobacteraceae bacterium]